MAACTGADETTVHLTKQLTEFLTGLEVPTSVVMNSTIFWDITPCNGLNSTDISEEYIASILRVEE
jgi:hypothetical protein